MKNKLKQNTTIKAKYSQVYKYATFSLAILVFVFITIFLVNNFINVDDAKAKGGPDSYESYTEKTGTWADDTMWDGSDAPPVSVPMETQIQINGFITCEGNLSLAKETSLTINEGDTLVIDGDFTVAKEAEIKLKNGGLLIVLGNMNADKELLLGIQGDMIVVGEATFAKDYDVNITGHLYLFDTSPDYGKDGSGEGSIETEADLQNNNNSLYKFVTEGAKILPVQLTSFEAIPFDSGVKITWTTASETNNDFFSIEKSRDAKDFKTIGTIKGAGDAQESQTYTYTDHEPYAGLSYYRLKQTDFDGKEEHFKVIAVEYEQTDIGNIRLSIYPNPSLNQIINMTVEGLTANQEGQLVIMDFSGNVVFKKQFISEGTTIHAEADPQNMTAGNYVVNLLVNGKRYTQKLILKK